MGSDCIRREYLIVMDVSNDPQASDYALKKRRLKQGILALTVLLLMSLSLNLVLGWKVFKLRGTVDRLFSQGQLEVNTRVPPIKARGIDGQGKVISYIESGLPTVLYFFSPGCDTCERNVDNIKALADLKRGEYQIIGLSLSDDGLQEYVAAHGINFPVYAGLGVETTLAYKLGRVPQTTVVSREGRVLGSWHGVYDGKLRPTIESYFQVALSRASQ